MNYAQPYTVDEHTGPVGYTWASCQACLARFRPGVDAHACVSQCTVWPVLSLNNKVGRILTFTVVLTSTEEGAIMRASGCNAHGVVGVIRNAIAGTVDAIADKGYRGKQADELIANGGIEVGRASASLCNT
jgi:hypothetical protein